MSCQKSVSTVRAEGANAAIGLSQSESAAADESAVMREASLLPPKTPVSSKKHKANPTDKGRPTGLGIIQPSKWSRNLGHNNSRRLLLQSLKMIEREHHVRVTTFLGQRGAAGNNQVQRIFNRHVKLNDFAFGEKNQEAGGRIRRMRHQNAHHFISQRFFDFGTGFFEIKADAPHAFAGKRHQ